MSTVTVSKDNFESTISENPIVLVDFWAEWCGPCRNFAPVFEAASENHDDIVFAKVDTDAERELAATFEIQSIPTLMAIRDQIVIFSQPGSLPAREFEKLIDAVKAVDMDQVRADIAAGQDQADS